MLKFIETWSSRRRAVADLSRLSDHALADLGIARADIAAVAAGLQDLTGRDDSEFPPAGHRNVPAWA